MAGVLIVALTVLAGIVTAPVGAAAAGDPPSVLRAGAQLVAGASADRMRSPNGEFVLYMGPGGFDLVQFAPLRDRNGIPTSAGTDVWMRDDPTGRVDGTRDHSVLRLQTNGRLVLKTSKGVVLWSNGVAAGAGSRLLLTSSGNLVVRDRNGVARWASHTNAIFLVPGRTLASGHHLYDRWDDHVHPATVTTLTMGRDGNLVKRCNDHVIWRSHTYSPGAYLSMEQTGDLVIRSTRGRIVWHTRTGRAGPLTYFDTRAMEIRQDTNRDLVTRWAAKIPYDAPC